MSVALIFANCIGFDVIDLGVDQSADDFVAAIKEHKPNVVGLSTLLTTTMPYMGVIVDAIRDSGLLDDVAILIGGAPINDAYAEKIDADAYRKSAGIAADTARGMIGT